MKCRDCRYIYTNDAMNGWYICANGDSDKFGSYIGLLCEDDCDDGVAIESEEVSE